MQLQALILVKANQKYITVLILISSVIPLNNTLYIGSSNDISKPVTF